MKATRYVLTVTFDASYSLSKKELDDIKESTKLQLEDDKCGEDYTLIVRKSVIKK